MTYNQIILDDCIHGMSLLPDESVDCILTDLPYECLHKSNQAVQWDRMIPLDSLWEQFLRITKPESNIILFGQGMFTAKLMMSQPKYWRYNLIWDKTRCANPLIANMQPLRCHEDIAIFYRKPGIYHPQMEIGPARHPRGKNAGEANSCYGKFKHLPDGTKERINKTGNTYDYAHTYRVPRTAPEEMKFPKSIVRFKKEHGKEVIHPTQKPVDLLRWLIRTYTDSGQLVLDACMGSASTAIACIREHRNYIGFETDERYFRLAQKRIQRENEQLTINFDV